MKIYLSFDFDYLSDYDAFGEIQKVIDVPCTVFLIGDRHPPIKFPFKENVQIGNHTYYHENWENMLLGKRVEDLRVNHEFLRNMYGVECNVFRSPHLRRFDDTSDEMEKMGYKREMKCAICTVCPPVGSQEYMQAFFSSHHALSCPKDYLENFEDICKQGNDFTFFLDPHRETPERVKSLIEIGKKYGEWCYL